MATKYRAKSGVWYIKHRDVSGRWRTKHIGRNYTKDQVELIRKKFDTTETNVKYGVNIPVKGLTIEELLKTFKQEVNHSGIVEHTRKFYASSINTIYRWFNHYHIDKIESININFINTFNDYVLNGENAFKYNVNTAVEIQKIFIRFLKWCIQHGYSHDYKPILQLRKLKKVVGRPRFFSKAELKLIFDNTLYSDVYQFFYYTGLRASELCNAKWEDYDSENNYLYLNKTKNKMKRDIIPLSDNALSIINRQDKTGEYIFKNLHGKKLTPKAINSYLYRFMAKNNIKGASVHTFRHSFASHLAMAGVPIKDISELLRHSDIKTTMIYAHLTKDHLRKSNNKLPTID